MPTPVLKRLAKESGKSLETVEKAWDEAKEAADKAFKEKHKDASYWSYVQIVTQRKLGIDDKKKEKEKEKSKAKKAGKKK